MKNQYLPYFFGTQADYYQEATEEVEAGKFRFNPAAFLAGVLWMGYRKMYLEAFVTLLIILIESFAEDLFFPALSENKGFSLATTIACNTIIGFIGNRLYVNFAKRQIAKLTGITTSELGPNITAQVRKRGGVAWYGPLLVLLMILVIVVILVLIADSLGIEID